MKRRSGIFIALAFVLISAVVGGAVSRWQTALPPAAIIAGRGGAEESTFPSFDASDSRSGAAPVEAAYREAMEIVTSAYGGDVNYERANQGSIQGMLSALDPHSSFFPDRRI
jgi:C-terminal processing protease CtpA/Prc